MLSGASGPVLARREVTIIALLLITERTSNLDRGFLPLFRRGELAERSNAPVLGTGNRVLAHSVRGSESRTPRTKITRLPT